jgi:cyanate permease
LIALVGVAGTAVGGDAVGVAGVVAVAYGWRGALLVLGAVGVVASLGYALAVGRGESARPRQARGGEKAQGWGIQKPAAFALISAIGIIDNSTRVAVLTFIPFLMSEKGLDAAASSLLLTLIFLLMFIVILIVFSHALILLLLLILVIRVLICNLLLSLPFSLVSRASRGVCGCLYGCDKLCRLLFGWREHAEEYHGRYACMCSSPFLCLTSAPPHSTYAHMYTRIHT